MKAKKLHTDECYVCIISFIHSILDSTLALALMPWPWSWPWPWGYEVMTLALAMILSVLAFINVTHWSMGCDIFRSVLWHCWLGDRKVIRPVKNWVLVHWWWWCEWSFARFTAPVVTTTSIILCFNGSPGKWPLKLRERVQVIGCDSVTSYPVISYEIDHRLQCVVTSVRFSSDVLPAYNWTRWGCSHPWWVS